MASPAPLTLSDSFGVRTRQKRPPSPAIRSTASGGVSRVSMRGDEHDLRAEPMHGRDGILHAGKRVGHDAREVFEFELVRRDDVGRRHRLLAHEFGNARTDEDATSDIADHRVAAIQGRRIERRGPARRRRGSRCRYRPTPYSPTARRRRSAARRDRQFRRRVPRWPAHRPRGPFQEP